MDIYLKELFTGNPIWNKRNNKWYQNFYENSGLPFSVLPSPLPVIQSGSLQNPSSSNEPLFEHYWLVLVSHIIREDNNAQKRGETYPISLISYTWKPSIKSTTEINFSWSSQWYWLYLFCCKPTGDYISNS